MGADFSSFIAHHCSCFIYVSIGNLAILLFRDGVAPESDKDQLVAIDTVKA